MNTFKTSFYAAGLSDEELRDISQFSKLSQGFLPIRYLGVPLCTKKLTLLQCAPLIQSVKLRISSWSSKLLSFAGRLQLLNSVISGITTFWVSSLILPKTCISEINSMCSKFLWKGKLDDFHSARVSWDMVTSYKDEGGLGLKNLVQWNSACILKLVWMLFFNKGSIWSTWYTKEVIDGNINNYWIINTRQKNSWMANKLIKFRNVVFPWIKQVVGNGETTYFWEGNWSPFGRISDFLHHDLLGRNRTGIPNGITLAELWMNDQWILPPARSDSLVEIYAYLSSMSLSSNSDYFEWWPNEVHANTYKTGDIYDLIRSPKPKVLWFNAIWFSGSIPRHRLASWLFVHNRSPTKDRQLSWGHQIDPLCLLCNSVPESRDHLFFECRYSW